MATLNERNINTMIHTQYHPLSSAALSAAPSTTATDKVRRPCTEVQRAIGALGLTQKWLHEEVDALLKKRGDRLPNYASFSRLLSGKAAITFSRAIAIADVLSARSGGQYDLEFLFPEISEMSAIGELQMVTISKATLTFDPPRNVRSVLLQPQGGAIRFTTDGSLPLRPARNRPPHGRILPDYEEKILPIVSGQKLKIQLVPAEAIAVVALEWRDI